MTKAPLVAAVLAAALLTGCTATAPTASTTPDAPASPSPIGRGQGGPPAGRGPGGWASTTPAPTQVPGSTTAPQAGTPQAAAWSALMDADGEYAAAASYQAVLDQFGDVEPYASIKLMEENHINALTRQLGRYGITPPANPYLGEVVAPASLAEAAQAWADGERANVALYDQLMEQAQGDPGLTRVFTNLRRSSLEAHLPLFEAAAKNGGTLTQQQMTDLGFAPHR